MRRLSKVQGYAAEQVNRFNEIFSILNGDTDHVQGIQADELSAFKEFYNLAEHDEKIRIEAMRGKKLNNYTPEEISRFNQMHEVLTEYNLLLSKKKDIAIPDFSDIEMMEYSKYRELLIAFESE